MNKVSLLPNARTPLEQHLTEHQHYHDFTVDIADINNPVKAPANFLPFLAWGLSVDYWGDDWIDEHKRQAIIDSFAIHSMKGTPASIKFALKTFGIDKVRIEEGLDAQTYEGNIVHDGQFYYGRKEHWAKYALFIEQALTREQGQHIRNILKLVAPARCHLIRIYYPEAGHSYNNEITYNGNYNHGAV
ncbi:MAG: phage tail protein I [Gammaproteobacteria bacterium]|nr:phage tail protein I [Gammaproteobacteria bacterium]